MFVWVSLDESMFICPAPVPLYPVFCSCVPWQLCVMCAIPWLFVVPLPMHRYLYVGIFYHLLIFFVLFFYVGLFQSEIYVVEDCVEYIDSLTHQFVGTSVQFYNLYSLPSGLSDFEVTAKINATIYSRFGLVVKQDNNNLAQDYCRLGVEFGNYASDIVHTSEDVVIPTTTPYVENKTISVKYAYQNGVLSTYIEGEQLHSTSINFNPLYVMLIHWNTGKSVTVTDLKVKPL